MAYSLRAGVLPAYFTAAAGVITHIIEKRAHSETLSYLFKTVFDYEDEKTWNKEYEPRLCSMKERLEKAAIENVPNIAILDSSQKKEWLDRELTERWDWELSVPFEIVRKEDGWALSTRWIEMLCHQNSLIKPAETRFTGEEINALRKVLYHFTSSSFSPEDFEQGELEIKKFLGQDVDQLRTYGSRKKSIQKFVVTQLVEFFLSHEKKKILGKYSLEESKIIEEMTPLERDVLFLDAAFSVYREVMNGVYQTIKQADSSPEQLDLPKLLKSVKEQAQLFERQKKLVQELKKLQKEFLDKVDACNEKSSELHERLLSILETLLQDCKAGLIALNGRIEDDLHKQTEQVYQSLLESSQLFLGKVLGERVGVSLKDSTQTENLDIAAGLRKLSERICLEEEVLNKNVREQVKKVQQSLRRFLATIKLKKIGPHLGNRGMQRSSSLSIIKPSHQKLATTKSDSDLPKLDEYAIEEAVQPGKRAQRLSDRKRKRKGKRLSSDEVTIQFVQELLSIGDTVLKNDTLAE